MMIHMIEPNENTLHGSFSRDYTPALSIDSGDTVRYRTLDADWMIYDVDGMPPKAESLWRGEIARFAPRDKVRDEGHAMCGPVFVRGAKPGMMLAIRILRIETGTWGWSLPWYGTPIEDKDVLPLSWWTIDKETMTARNQKGFSVPVKPFMGVMGLAPAKEGVHFTKTPYPTGGNLDCKELVEGSTLYLPVEVEGALFSVGDGHAVQGDGESSGTAIECPMKRVDLTFELVENPPIKTLYADTPASWLTFGLNEDLNIAMQDALDAMVSLIMVKFNITSRYEALDLASLTVDLHITQIVNGVRGVHAVLPRGVLRTYDSLGSGII